MISIQTMKDGSGPMIGEEFPLVMRPGAGRIVGADERGLSLLVAGTRVQYTWERLTTTWNRLLSNQTLGIDELGGGPDAVGIVSLFAYLQGDSLDVAEADGLLVLKHRNVTPVHQYADMGRPTTWAPWRRKSRAG
jgi:hypothetical protein